MKFSIQLTHKLEEIITTGLRKKMQSYKPETKHMPFHHRLLGKDRMALFSFIHSLNTTFGTSIFEPVAETLAGSFFETAQKQYVVGNLITEQAQYEIQNIINSLSMGKSNPDQTSETEIIRQVCKKGRVIKIKMVKADLFLIDKKGTAHLIDIKTAKPNISQFKDFKRTLLEWIAVYLFNNPDANVTSYLAIPYNPYYPKPYERWTLKGMIDPCKELKVEEEFWDLLGGEGAFSQILDCFERAGIQTREEIDLYFSNYK